MKTTIKVLAMILSAILMLGLYACGGGSGTENNTANGNGNETQSNTNTSTGNDPAKLCDSDEEYLKSQGYTVWKYSSYLENYANALGVSADALSRTISAYNDNGDSMIIYYFKTEAQAKACCENDVTNSFKQVGLRVVYGDPQNLIK